MSGSTAGGAAEARWERNAALFFKRWLANPLQMGSVIPSSRRLSRRIGALAERAPEQVVLELGAGTGVISRALLAAGVPAGKLAVVEIVPEMAGQLRKVLPGVNVICGDAFALARDLAERLHGKVDTALCGVPLDEQRRFAASIEAVAPG